MTMYIYLLLGSLFFPGLFCVCKRCISATVSLPGWGEADTVILATRLVSSVQAVMASTAGFVVATACSKHVLDDRHWLTDAYVLFAVPYFLYDIYAMFLCHRHRLRVKGHAAAIAVTSSATSYLHREPLMVLHHLVMVCVCFPVSVYVRGGRGDYFVGCMFMAEVSTPFVCLGKILIQYGRQHTLLHRLNGALMLLSFLWCRVLLFPALYWAYGRELGLPLLQVPGHLPLLWNVGAALLLAPQIYWFLLILRGALRLFLGPPPSLPRPPGGLANKAQGQPRPPGVTGVNGELATSDPQVKKTD